MPVVTAMSTSADASYSLCAVQQYLKQTLLAIDHAYDACGRGLETLTSAPTDGSYSQCSVTILEAPSKLK